MRDFENRGIIPARAGFTWWQCLCADFRRDHPRSRGVYPSPRVDTPAPLGSSPLARGLLHAVVVLRGVCRIIPARAGFTSPNRRAQNRSRDHPRSRGVYHRVLTKYYRMVGSSPLARGLHGSCLACILMRRIIPARAGFTPWTRPSPVTCWDHPRSRGVYKTPTTILLAATGSSPLARGLRAQRRSVPASARIIPARAGFTGCPGPASPCREDHPRSRGVYGDGVDVGDVAEGSSPLARGLLSTWRRLCPRGRIIPARAGFTQAMCLRWCPTADHPRSRGVYCVLVACACACVGSSPLARGLRVVL